MRFDWCSFLLIALPFARGDGSRHFNPDGVRGPGPARAVGHAEFCQDERQTGPGFLIDDFPQPDLIATEERADCFAALNQRAQHRREGFDFIVRRNAFAGHDAIMAPDWFFWSSYLVGLVAYFVAYLVA